MILNRISIFFLLVLMSSCYKDSNKELIVTQIPHDYHQVFKADALPKLENFKTVYVKDSSFYEFSRLFYEDRYDIIMHKFNSSLFINDFFFTQVQSTKPATLLTYNHFGAWNNEFLFSDNLKLDLNYLELLTEFPLDTSFSSTNFFYGSGKLGTFSLRFSEDGNNDIYIENDLFNRNTPFSFAIIKKFNSIYCIYMFGKNEYTLKKLDLFEIINFSDRFNFKDLKNGDYSIIIDENSKYLRMDIGNGYNDIFNIFNNESQEQIYQISVSKFIPHPIYIDSNILDEEYITEFKSTCNCEISSIKQLNDENLENVVFNLEVIQNNTSFLGESIHIVKDDIIYVVTYIAEKSIFDEYKQEFEKSFDSFQING